MPAKARQGQSHQEGHLWTLRAALIWVHSQLPSWACSVTCKVANKRSGKHEAKYYSLGLMNTLTCSWEMIWRLCAYFASLMAFHLRHRDCDKILQQFRLSSSAQFGWLPFHTCHALDCDSPLSWRSGCFLKLSGLCLARSFEPHENSLVQEKRSHQKSSYMHYFSAMG